MNDIKFHAGDRVTLIRTPYDISSVHLPAGSTGTVVYVARSDATLPYWVNWDHEFPNGYFREARDGSKMIKGHGWKVSEDVIELIEESPCAAISVEELERFIAGI